MEESMLMENVLSRVKYYVNEKIRNDEIRSDIIKIIQCYVDKKKHKLNFLKGPVIIKNLLQGAEESSENDYLLYCACCLIEIGVVFLDDIHDHELPTDLSSYNKHELILIAVIMITNLPNQIIHSMKLSNKIKLHLLQTISENELDMATGQIGDIGTRKNEFHTIKESLDLIKRKNGAWRALYPKLAAIANNGSPEQIEDSYQFGIAVGIIKQIMNDLSDIYQDRVSLSSDLSNNTKSFPLSVYFELANDEDKIVFKKILDEINDNPTILPDIQEMIAKEEVLSYIVNTLGDYEIRATNHLNSLSKEVNAKNILKQFHIDVSMFYMGEEK